MNEQTPEQEPAVEADAPEESPSNKGSGGGDPPKTMKVRSGKLGILLKALKWTVITLSIFIILLLFLLAFFPLNFVKNVVMEEVAELEDIGLEIGHVDFFLFTGLEIEDIRLGAPEGYSKPILTVKRIVLSYNPIALPFSKLIIDEILIDSPHFNLETINGKTNIDAFLENLPKGDEVEEPPEPVESDGPGEPLGIETLIHRVAVEHFSAWVDDGERVIDFKQLDLNLSGHFSQDDSHFDLNLAIGGEDADVSNISFEQKTPEALKADIMLKLAVQVAIDRILDRADPPATGPDNRMFGYSVLAPKTKIGIDIELDTKKLEAEYALDPVNLKLSVEAEADMKKDTAIIEKLALFFNDKQLVQARAELLGLLEQKEIALLLESINLPLDAFAPYAKAFMDDVDFGGEIAIEQLKAESDIQRLLNLPQQGLPKVSGKIAVHDLWAKYGAEKVELSGFQADLNFSTTPSDNDEDPQQSEIKAGGSISLASASHPLAIIKDLNTRLDASADGIEPKNATAGLIVSIGRLTLRDPKQGDTDLTFHLDLAAGGDMQAGEFEVKHMAINISDTIKMNLNAKAGVDLATMNIRHHQTHLKLSPMNLKKLLDLAPPGVKEQLPKLTLAGSLGLDVQTSGAVPKIPTGPDSAMALPVKFDIGLMLSGIHVDYPEMKLKVRNFGGRINMAGRPSDATIKGLLHLDSVIEDEQQLTVGPMEIPIDMRLRPSQADIKLGVNIADVKHGLQAASVDQLALEIAAKIEGRLLKQRFNRMSGTVELKLDEVLYAKDMTARVKGPSLDLGFDYLQDKKSVDMTLKAGLDSLKLAEQDLSVDGFSFELSAEAHGVDIPIGPKPDIHPELAQLRVAMDVESIDMPKSLYEPLKETSLRMQASMHEMRDVDLENFRFRMPTLGVLAKISGKVWGVMSKNFKMPDFKTRFPEFDVKLFAGLDIPERRTLVKGVEAVGLVGIKGRARSLTESLARIDGKIVAKDFSAWTRSESEVEMEDGRVEKVIDSIQVKDFDSGVPLTQIVNLKTRQPVAAKGNIFKESSRSVLYETLRRYMKEQSNFRIDNILYKQVQGETVKKFSVDEIALDMIYTDNTFAVNRMYVDLLGGGITGAFQLQLAALPPEPFDFRLHFENQITGVNLGYLTKRKVEEVSSETEISSMVNFNFGLLDRYTEGRIDITRLSLAQLDELLIFLDPDGKDPKVQMNRAMINGTAANILDPKVKLVSMWIQYGNLNMDIKFKVAVFEKIIQDILDKMKIRRLNIMPILNMFLPQSEEEDGNQAEKKPAGEQVSRNETAP